MGLQGEADPPNAAQYDVGNLEFDPIRITQENSTYFELMVRDRVNQAARACTLAFAVGGDLDAIASRYPGGMPRLTGETDDAYWTRIWLSPNTLTQNGVYENYIFFAFTAAEAAGMPLRDVQALATPGKANVDVVIMADGTPVTPVQDSTTGARTFTPFPSPTPTDAQVSAVFDYLTAPGMGRKGLTDVVNVRGPKIKDVAYSIRIQLYPGWDQTLSMAQLNQALATLIQNQRYLGYSHTLAAIDAALKVSGVFNVIKDSPSADVIIPTDTVVRVTSVKLDYAGRAGFGPPSPAS